MNRSLWLLVVGILLFLGAGGAVYYHFFAPETYTVDIIEHHTPPAKDDDVLVDDKLDEKNPAFDPKRIDRRPVGEWQVNLSAAVTRLDVAAVNPESEAEFLVLHPSYAQAKEKLGEHLHGHELLPSVNMVDSKAKQFDDGLYAALDQAYYRGLDGKLRSHVDLVRRLHEKLAKDGDAAAFLAAGLELAGVKIEAVPAGKKQKWLDEFRQNEAASKPIGFYTWNTTLSDCFRFLRFFQHEFSVRELSIPIEIAQVLAQDRKLRTDYEKALTFYARLTNPYLCLAVADLIDLSRIDAAAFANRCREKKVPRQAIALLPASSTREVVLFEKLFPDGLPPNADLMRELIRKIRSGQVDLKPGKESGWYDHQAYALETLLLPGRGEEKDHLMLMKAYKKRMLEAFQVLITRRQETHVRQRGGAKNEASSAARPLDRGSIKPRLRVEPCPTFFLRTARAYNFLGNFLDAAIGKDTLEKMHGLSSAGNRKLDLHAELALIRELFYGLYLVSSEDIGHEPHFAKDEVVDAERCYEKAVAWLKTAFADSDLAEDTRISVPIMIDTGRGATRLWAVVGVRMVKLQADFARPPHVRPRDAKEWKHPEHHEIGKSKYLIPVDEFVEVELPGLRALTREELRAICDREKTRDAIVSALRQAK